MGPAEVFSLMNSSMRRVRGMIGRGIINLVDDAKKMQTVQIQTLGNETSDGVERYQNFGWTSVPMPPDANGQGAEAIVVAVGGDRSLEVVIVVDDRRFRIVGLAAGEAAAYNAHGQKILLKTDRIIVEGPRIELGDGATKAVARSGDPTVVNGTSDAAFLAWMVSVDVAIGVAALLPGHAAIVPTVSPSTVTGSITAGSSVVKAVD